MIKECERLGIVTDLSHANEATVTAALKITRKPFLISHTCLNARVGTNERMGKMFSPRVISPEHAKFVAGKGGVIGVWTHLADSALEYAQNIRAMIDVVGINHVCIGTDTKLTQTADRQGGNPNQGFRSEGSNKNWPHQTSGFYYAGVDALLKVGFTAAEISKVGGGNFCRVFDEVTRKNG